MIKQKKRKIRIKIQNIQQKVGKGRKKHTKNLDKKNTKYEGKYKFTYTSDYNKCKWLKFTYHKIKIIRLLFKIIYLYSTWRYT